jgi:MoxR-like ATPase
MPPLLSRLRPARSAPAPDVAPTDAPAAAPPAPRSRMRGSQRSLLRPLGIVGYDHAEPALLAALATEEPLLLVSDHGAAKTLLLLRLAEALGVELRHYNASLLQFDDLAGFPIPDDRGGIRYAAPPGAIWGAQAVFLDEIGRCRPEVANKLFPIVHERRIQGIKLERLRYRWAATNPPAEAQDGDADTYVGVEPLDPALADRFTYVLPLPAWRELGEADRAAVVRGVPDTLTAEAGASLRAVVADTRALIPVLEAEVGEAAVTYVLSIAPLLASSGIIIGGRRAAMLRRAIVAVHAACVALGRPLGSDSFALALQSAIPDVVRRVLKRSVLSAAHAAAYQQLALPPEDPARRLAAVTDPVQRAALALQLPGLRAAVRGEAISTALTALAEPTRSMLAWQLLPRAQRHDTLPATAVEAILEVLRPGVDGGMTVRAYSSSSGWITMLRERLARSPLAPAEAEFLFNVLAPRYPQNNPFGGSGKSEAVQAYVDAQLQAWDRCRAAFGEPPVGGAS